MLTTATRVPVSVCGVAAGALPVAGAAQQVRAEVRSRSQDGHPGYDEQRFLHWVLLRYDILSSRVAGP